jgi:hypothetical protein
LRAILALGYRIELSGNLLRNGQSRTAGIIPGMSGFYKKRAWHILKSNRLAKRGTLGHIATAYAITRENPNI